MNWLTHLRGVTLTMLLVALLSITIVSCSKAPLITRGGTMEKLDDTHYKVNDVWLYQQYEAGLLLEKDLALCREGLK